MSATLERATFQMLFAVQAVLKTSRLAPEHWPAATQYLLVTCCNVPGVLAAKAYGCSKQNISKALRAVEDRRDDPHYDAEISRLEEIFTGQVNPNVQS